MDEPPPQPTAERPGRAPVGPLQGERWGEHAARFAATGLWPLVLEESIAVGLPEEEPALGDALAVLTAGWADATHGDKPGSERARRLDPFGPQAFPGLADAASGERIPAAHAALAELQDDVGLLLVPVARPADVLLALAWDGACNYDLDGGQLSAVLRSWEDRFDAIPVGLGVASLTLAVRRAPTGEAALRVAAEHFAFCPDTVDQGVLSIRALAEELDGAPSWMFWWD